MNKNSEKRKYKDKKLFAGSAIIVYLEINMIVISKDNFSTLKLSKTLTMSLFSHKNSWYLDISTTKHLYNIYNAFINYIKFITLQAIENISGSNIYLSKDTKCLNIDLTN